eukprot:11226002-Lingulodinium_polyedra.AAC.1
MGAAPLPPRHLSGFSPPRTGPRSVSSFRAGWVCPSVPPARCGGPGPPGLGVVGLHLAFGPLG